MLKLLSIRVITLYLQKFKLILGLLTITKWLHKKLKNSKYGIDLTKIFVACKPKMYKLRLLRNRKRNLQFFSIYFHKIEMFINKNVKYWKNPIPVSTELPCDGGDNDESEGVEVDGSNKDVGFDNVNAGDGENKVDRGDVDNDGGNNNDDAGVDDVDRVNPNGGDDADFGNGDSKFDCGNDRGSGDGDDKDDGGVDGDGDVDSNIGNDLNCGDGRSKVDYSKYAAADDDDNNLMVVVILMMMVRVVMIVMLKVMMMLMDIEMMVMMMMDVGILLKTSLKTSK